MPAISVSVHMVDQQWVSLCGAGVEGCMVAVISYVTLFLTLYFPKNAEIRCLSVQVIRRFHLSSGIIDGDN